MARFLVLELVHEGYQVEAVRDGRAGIRRCLEEAWGVVLLDVMLPGLNGIEVCRRLRAASDVPIIMLTARDAVPDRVSGLDAGADDYLVKPFAIEELLARMRVQMRRRSAAPESVLLAGDLRLDPARRSAERAGQSLDLTKTEFDLLEYLVRNTSIVLSRETLLREVWGYDYLGGSNIVDVYIRYLRSKVDTPFGSRLIHTVRGVGYVVKEVEAATLNNAQSAPIR